MNFYQHFMIIVTNESNPESLRGLPAGKYNGISTFNTSDQQLSNGELINSNTQSGFCDIYFFKMF
jgi:hypothetical protein